MQCIFNMLWGSDMASRKRKTPVDKRRDRRMCRINMRIPEILFDFLKDYSAYKGVSMTQLYIDYLNSLKLSVEPPNVQQPLNTTSF